MSLLFISETLSKNIKFYKSADEFFSLPDSQKLKIRQPAKHISRGYTPFAAEQLSAGLGNISPPDLKEMIDIGPIDIPDDPYFSKPEAGDHFHPNLWPDQPFGFRKIMETYYKEMNLLADLLMEIFSLSLNLFTESTSSSNNSK